MPTTATATRSRRVYAPKGAVGKKLERARQLTNQIAELKAELEPLREAILQHLIERDLDNISCGDFEALRKSRANWSYTPKTEREMLALRNLQKWEQQRGDATNTPTIYLQMGAKR